MNEQTHLEYNTFVAENPNELSLALNELAAHGWRYRDLRATPGSGIFPLYTVIMERPARVADAADGPIITGGVEELNQAITEVAQEAATKLAMKQEQTGGISARDRIARIAVKALFNTDPISPALDDDRVWLYIDEAARTCDRQPVLPIDHEVMAWYRQVDPDGEIADAMIAQVKRLVLEQVPGQEPTVDDPPADEDDRGTDTEAPADEPTPDPEPVDEAKTADEASDNPADPAESATTEEMPEAGTEAAPTNDKNFVATRAWLLRVAAGNGYYQVVIESSGGARTARIEQAAATPLQELIEWATGKPFAADLTPRTYAFDPGKVATLTVEGSHITAIQREEIADESAPDDDPPAAPPAKPKAKKAKKTARRAEAKGIEFRSSYGRALQRHNA